MTNLSKTEQKVLSILAANPNVWVENLPRTMPGVRCSTIQNLRKKGLIKQGKDEGQVFFGYKLVEAPVEDIDTIISNLVFVPCPDDADASKADAAIVERLRNRR